MRVFWFMLIAFLANGCADDEQAEVPLEKIPNQEEILTPGDPAVLSVGGKHTCAIRSSGAVVCWGDNNRGQLGDGTKIDRLTPTQVVDLVDAVEVTTSHYYTCARRTTGTVVCWGGNDYAELGDGTADSRLTPTAVTDLLNVVEISAGGKHTCARRATGTVVCWGANWTGQLGVGNTSTQFGSRPETGLLDAVEISAGTDHTCARLSDSTVACWGDNGSGQIGDGSTTGRVRPSVVSGLEDAVQISTGYSHTCARRANGTVVCWGDNGEGQLGGGTTDRYRVTPIEVTGLIDAVEISSKNRHTCARRASGAVVCWGGNRYGQLGDGTTTARSMPTPVSGGLNDVVEISAGAIHTCARRATGAIVCWGDNGLGQLGDGTTIDHFTPTPVISL